MIENVRKKYTFRMAAALASTIGLTLVFGVVFAAQAAAVPGTGVSVVVGLMLVTVLHVGIVGIVTGGNMGVELTALIAATRAVEQGEYETEIAVTRADEVGQLAGAFNTMLETLQTAFADEQDAQDRRRTEEARNETLLSHADVISGAMQSVASGDFTAHAPTETEIQVINEIGTTYEEMATELSVTIADLRSFAETVETTSDSIVEDAARVETDHREFATAVRSQAEQISAQTDELLTVSREAGNLTATIEEIAATADDVAGQSTEAASLSARGSDQSAEAIDAMDTIADSIDELTQLIGALDDRMETVEQSTGLIDDIADQTNILALNANIEAARAGADGAGFGVVAGEVKSLAEQTQNQSQHISHSIAETRADVDQVIDEMDTAQQQITSGVGTIEAAGELFESLSKTVSAVDISVGEVAHATDDAAATTEEVTATVEEVATAAQRMVSTIETLAKNAEESAAVAATIHEKMQQLHGQTQSLQTKLAHFSIRAESHADEPASQIAGAPSPAGTSSPAEPAVTDGGNR